jgi:phosphoribosylcarboxyaminoimidazole (NCAIR) mutase
MSPNGGGGIPAWKKRKIGVMIGSDSDLIQCEPGLRYLIDMRDAGEIDLSFVDIASQHRHTLVVQGILAMYSLQPKNEKVDVLIIGAGMANHLTGCCDAFLRNTLKDKDIFVYGVAFDDQESRLNTDAAVLSVSRVPGTQAEFDGYVGENGFTRACRDAVEESLRELYVKPVKPPRRLTFDETLQLTIQKKKEQTKEA